MSFSQALAPRSTATLDTIQKLLGDLVARHRQDDVLTSVRHIPARDAKFRPVPHWVASALSEYIAQRESRNCIRIRRQLQNWSMTARTSWW